MRHITLVFCIVLACAHSRPVPLEELSAIHVVLPSGVVINDRYKDDRNEDGLVSVPLQQAIDKAVLASGLSLAVSDHDSRVLYLQATATLSAHRLRWKDGRSGEMDLTGTHATLVFRDRASGSIIDTLETTLSDPPERAIAASITGSEALRQFAASGGTHD
jgi:hypothetical protein